MQDANGLTAGGDAGSSPHKTSSHGVTRRTFLAIAGCMVALPAFAAPSEWPDKPVSIMVPNPAGGMTDFLARAIAEQVQPLWGQPVVVHNRPGASGHLAAQHTARAEPDGYTLLLGTIGIHAAFSSYQKLPYAPDKDLETVMIVAESPNVVLVPANSPFRTFPELLEHAKKDPQSLNYATAGPGSSIHMVTALFNVESGIDVNYVPYKGSAPAMLDLIGGQVQVMFDNLPTALGQIKAGKVRALAVTGRQRDSRLPDVPTIAESGLPNYEAMSWFTVAVPKGTPRPVIEKLSKDLKQVLSTPSVIEKLDAQSANLVLSSPEEARTFVTNETAKWNRVITATQMRLD